MMTERTHIHLCDKPYPVAKELYELHTQVVNICAKLGVMVDGLEHSDLGHGYWVLTYDLAEELHNKMDVLDRLASRVMRMEQGRDD